MISLNRKLTLIGTLVASSCAMVLSLTPTSGRAADAATPHRLERRT